MSKDNRAALLCTAADHTDQMDRDQQDQMDHIYATVNAILNRYVYRMPVDVFAICRALNIPVRDTSYYVERGLTLEELFIVWGNRDGAAGCINGQDIINYRETAPGTRMRFTVAEELMHILLGHTRDTRFAGCPAAYSAELYQRYEREAKTAAGMLLVPFSVYYRLRRRGVREIARVCRVSEACAWTTSQYYESDMERARTMTTRKTILMAL